MALGAACAVAFFNLTLSKSKLDGLSLTSLYTINQATAETTVVRFPVAKFHDTHYDTTCSGSGEGCDPGCPND